MTDTSEVEIRTTDHGTQTAGHPATHYVVVSAEDLRLVLTVGDEPAISLVLGPADAMALACDLLNAARPRLGR